MQGKWRYIMILISILLFLTACGSENEGQTQGEQPDEDVNIEQEDTEQEETEVDPGSTDTETKSNNEEEITLEDLPPIPTDVAGLSEQSSGPFGGYHDNIHDYEEEFKEEFEKIGPMSENPSDKEYETYLRFMYWLVAEDYPNPEDTIKKWEFGSFGNPDLPDSRYHFKENYNVEILLDSSGSMANYAGEKTRMQIAKEAITEFLSNVPEEANVSLRVYGHEGTGSESDKAMSCDSIEQVYGYDSYDEAAFEESLNQFDPAGWTPLGDALETAHESMESFDTEDNTNLIYVVSDGIETCGGDPVDVAEQLTDSNAQPIINIIGFQTDAEAQEQLEEMAEVADGIYASANNQDELQAEFDRAEEALEAWEDWKEDALRDIDAAEVDNSFDIMGLHNDYHFTTLGMSNNMNSLGYILVDLGIITYDQRSEIIDRKNEIRDKIDQANGELEKELEEISLETLEETREQIEDRFDEQTEE